MEVHESNATMRRTIEVVEGPKLSHRAEIFRSKLIEEFQILEGTSEQGRKKVPVYSTTEMIDPEIMEKVLTEAPEQMIKFKAYKRGHIRKSNFTGHRFTRVCHQKRLPYSVWAHIVVESNILGSIFQNTLLIITLLSSFTIGIQGELPQSTSTAVVVFNMMFDLIDTLTVIVFVVEIILKWTDNFTDFWKDWWNIFDLFVTVMSLVSTILLPFTSSMTDQFARIAERLLVFRILRVLKLVTRLSRLRIVILTVLQTVQSVLFIILLLLLVSYVYSIIGVIVFQSYTESTRDDLKFNGCFRDIPNTMLTLFQLFTLDQWYNIYKDLIKITSPYISLTYILIWIFIGSFVFRNLFVGIMVNNFQSLSAQLVLTKETQDKTIELARLRKELSDEIIRHNHKLKRARDSVFSDEFSEEDSKWSGGSDRFGQLVIEEEKISKGWDEIVEEHLAALASNPVETLWPRDTLFRYYQVMEQLQDNLEEYDRIQAQMAKYLLSLYKVDVE